MSKNKSVLLIPDIHGRNFWKEGLEKRNPGEIIIFLGDYTDPYPEEGISYEKIPEEMEKIFNTPDSIFLIGNHDLSYLFERFPSYREDKNIERRKKIKDILESKWDKIQITHLDEDNKILYSHAGLLQQTYLHFGGETRTPEWIHSYFEDAWKKHDYKKLCALSWVSWWRGGDYNNGSLVWADLREHIEEENLPNYWWDGFQVFAHTKLRPGIIIEEKNFAMIDCRRPVRFFPKTHKFEIL